MVTEPIKTIGNLMITSATHYVTIWSLTENVSFIFLFFSHFSIMSLLTFSKRVVVRGSSSYWGGWPRVPSPVKVVTMRLSVATKSGFEVATTSSVHCNKLWMMLIGRSKTFLIRLLWGSKIKIQQSKENIGRNFLANLYKKYLSLFIVVLS